MVFTAISSKGKSNICICDKCFKINSETYIEILQNIVLPYLKQFKKNTEMNGRTANTKIGELPSLFP